MAEKWKVGDEITSMDQAMLAKLTELVEVYKDWDCPMDCDNCVLNERIITPLEDQRSQIRSAFSISLCDVICMLRNHFDAPFQALDPWLRGADLPEDEVSKC